MKRTYRYATADRFVVFTRPDGRVLRVPVIAGILKHPHPTELDHLLRDERVIIKYTRLALQKAAWPVLKQFPSDWLLECLPSAALRPSREKAIRYLLS